MTGTHLALDRDDAKQLFARRDPEALNEWLVNDALVRIAGDQRLELRDWRLAQRLLGDGSLEANEYPLDQCFLGGRPLDAGSDLHVRVIRPDTVAHIADALANFPMESVSDKVQALPQDYVGDRDAATVAAMCEQLQQLRVFFQTAAQAPAAVVFCAGAD